MVNQSGAISWYQCGDLGCDEEYIGEPEGPLSYSSSQQPNRPPHQP